MKLSTMKLYKWLTTTLNRRSFYLLLFIVYSIGSDVAKLILFLMMGAVFYSIALNKKIVMMQKAIDEGLEYFKQECKFNNVTVNKILQVGRDKDG